MSILDYSNFDDDENEEGRADRFEDERGRLARQAARRGHRATFIGYSAGDAAAFVPGRPWPRPGAM